MSAGPPDSNWGTVAIVGGIGSLNSVDCWLGTAVAMVVGFEGLTTGVLGNHHGWEPRVVCCFLWCGVRGKGRAGVLACALKGPTGVWLSPMFSIGFT